MIRIPFNKMKQLHIYKMRSWSSKPRSVLIIILSIFWHREQNRRRIRKYQWT